MSDAEPKAADAPQPAPLVSHDELVGAKDLATLRALYRERGATGSDEEVLKRATSDWCRLALERANEISEDPERFEPERASIDDIEIRVFGVCHGMLGGNDSDYKEFTDEALSKLERTLFENGLGIYYPAKESIWIPDFVVLGAGGSLAMGIVVGVWFWVLMRELVQDLLKIGGRDQGELAAYDFSRRYHAVPMETRRGLDLEQDAPLPSHLHIELELTELEANGALASFHNPFMIAPRSMFMAAFAVGYARSRGLTEVDLVVGDLHTAEIVHFLRTPPRDHYVWKWGLEWGEKSNAARRFGMTWAKVKHLGISGMTGSTILFFQLGLLLLGYSLLGPAAFTVVLLMVGVCALAYSKLRDRRAAGPTKDPASPSD